MKIAKSFKSVIAAVMAVVMCLTMLPAITLEAFAAQAWQEVAFADITATDTVAIVMAGSGKAAYALANDGGTSTKGKAVAFSATDTSANIQWHIEAVDGGYKIVSASDSTKHLYVTAANNGVCVGDTETGSVFNITDGYFTATDSASKTRYVGVYYTTPNFRCYTSINTNITGQTMTFYKLVEATEEPGTDETEPTEPEATEPEATEPEATEPEDQGTYIELTKDSLGLTASYADGAATVSNVEIGFIQLYAQSSGIQMRNKNSKPSAIFNNGEMPGGITKIVLSYAANQTPADKSNVFAFTFGDTADALGNEVSLSIAAGVYEYTVTPAVQTSRFFKMLHTGSNTFYWDSIKIYYDASIAAPELSAVAQIGETTYTSWSEAMDAVQAGQTLTLLADITVNTALTLKSGVTYEIPADKTLTVAADVTAESGAVISGAGKIVVNDGVTLDISALETFATQLSIAADAIVVMPALADWAPDTDTAILVDCADGATILLGDDTWKCAAGVWSVLAPATIADALAGEVGTEWKVTGYVTYVNSGNVYIQDATGAICLYFTDSTHGITVGQTVTASGDRADYNGLPELTNVTYSVADEAMEAPAAVEITAISQITNDLLCKAVILKGMTVTVADSTVTLSDGVDTINVYSAKKDGLKVCDIVDLSAVVSIHTSGLQLRNDDAADFVVTGNAHVEGEAAVENEVAATCGTAGSYDSVVKCTVCTAELSRTTVTVDATGEHSYDEGVVTTEPTYEAAGVMTYTCGTCGATKTEEIPQLEQPAVSGTFARKGATLSLSGLTYMNMYVTIEGFEGIDIATNGGLLVWNSAVTEAEAVIGTEDYHAEGLIYNSSYKAWAQQTNGIVARMYADTIYIRAYVKDDAGNYYYSDIMDESVREYCEGRITNSSDAKMVAACTELLHYGAAAQIYKGYNTGDLANKNIAAGAEFNESMIDELVAPNTQIVGSSLITKLGATLTLGEAIRMNLYVKPDASIGTLVTKKMYFWQGVEGELTLENATSCVDMLPGNGGYGGQTEDVVARGYGDTIYGCAYFVDENGNEYYSEVYNMSPEQYALGRIQKSSDANMVAVAKALVVYGEAAKAYLN